MSLLLPALVLSGALAATYLFCVRPMRRGACPMVQMARAERCRKDRPAAAATGLDVELARARQELRVLREQAGAAEHKRGR